MRAAGWQRLDEIFADAREVSVEEREAFVADACGGDTRLRAEVLSLLSANDASGEFMSKPALETLAQAFAADGWSLQPGQRLGAYTVIEMLGSGGAGEVWRARDERLDRDVAIKVLLRHLARDDDRLGRFTEEMRAIASLNHSNVLSIYDVGNQDGVPYFVSECLEGRNLRQRLEHGPLPVAETVRIAHGVASGLAAAHAHGIVHRDLKPENVFIKSDGTVKVLDFGLAKLVLPVHTPAARDNRTVAGAIVGTAAYMAPEQVNGETADARTDLFALGVVMHEMITGRHPFRGDSTLATLHAIVNDEPSNPVETRTGVPPALAHLVGRLLQKSRDARFQSANDLAWSLQEISDASGIRLADPAPPNSAPSQWWRRKAWLAAVAAGAALLVTAWWVSREPVVLTAPGETLQFTWTLPAGLSIESPPTVSPNGRYIAFVGRDDKGGRLYVRDLGSLEARTVTSSDGARLPFWSPDSRSLGFFSGSALMTVAWPNGAPVAIAKAPFGRGGTWGKNDDIVYAPDLVLSGLNRVNARGGKEEATTILDTANQDLTHGWPVFLPDGVHYLFYNRSMLFERRGVYVGRIDRPATHAPTLLMRVDSNVAFAPLPQKDMGVLFNVANGRVEARRINLQDMTISSQARSLDFPAGELTILNAMMLSASADVLAMSPAAVPFGSHLMAVDRDGGNLELLGPAEQQNWPRISPDGRFLARFIVTGLSGNPDIWVDDIERGTRTRLTQTLAPDMLPVWSRDGKLLAYATGNLPLRAADAGTLSIAAADGTGVHWTTACPGDYCEPTDWSADGQFLLLNVITDGNEDIWTMPTDDSDIARPLLSEPFAERDGRLSPNGRWLAYVSEESGKREVSVRTISGPARRMLISAAGGTAPVWRRDGGELYYVDLEGALQSLTVSWNSDGDPVFGLPVRLNVPPIDFAHWGTQYDVSPDGSRIYFLQANDDPRPREIHVVVGWQALLD